MMIDRRKLLIGAGTLGASLAAAPLARAAGVSSDRFSMQVAGHGPDVILIPGLDSSRHVWDGLVAHLKGRFRLHLPQLAGFAGEPARGNAQGPVVAPVAEDLARYIEAAGLKRPAVIGHSMGGTIGMELAARHPADVGRLMIVDMPPFLSQFFFGPEATVESARPLAAKMREGIENGSAAEREKAVTAAIAGMIRTESARAIYVREGLDSDRSVAGRSMEELLTTDLRPELKNITAPVTVVYVWTPAYPVTAEQLDAGYKALFAPVAGVRLVRIPDSYHFVMIDQPERFAAVVDGFLS